MTIVAGPLYSPRRYRRARVAVFILTLLGLMTFAAVRGMTVQCRTHDDCLLVNEGGCLLLSGKPGDVLLIGTQTRRCDVSGWGVQVELSERAEAILRKLGAMRESW
jgi:hypothetical protein